MPKRSENYIKLALVFLSLGVLYQFGTLVSGKEVSSGELLYGVTTLFIAFPLYKYFQRKFPEKYSPSTKYWIKWFIIIAVASVCVNALFFLIQK